MKFVNGWAFPDSDKFMSDHIGADGRYQSEHYYAARRYVKDFRVVVDAGAHVGTWSRLMAADFKRVIAIEPSADTFDCLRANTEHLPNVERKLMGLGEKAGRATMHLTGLALEYKNTGARYVVDDPSGMVPIRSLDSLNLDALGFLKMDIEGSEVFALRGGLKTLARCKPIVLFEDKGFWKRYGIDRHEPQKILLGAGYQQLERVKMDEIWGPA